MTMTNADRAECGAQAVAAGCPDCNDEYTNLKDALCSLMHYANAENIDFGGALTGAEMHFEAEQQEEADALLAVAEADGKAALHARFPKTDWQYEVANGDTSLGYADWLAAKGDSS